MRPWQIAALSAIVTAGLASAMASHEDFESRLVRVEAERALPSLASWLADESPEINALFLNYASDPPLWMSASLAIVHHGDVAREVIVEYGLTRRFQRVLKRFGADTVLPVSYFRTHDVTTLRARHWIGQRYRQIGRWWHEEEAEPRSPEFTPHRRGLMGIALLEDHGHALLNQFVVGDEGRVHWLQGERLVAGVGGLFTAGLRDLESQWRRGDDIGAGDVGWAGVDLLVMASAVKVLRAGRAAGSARPVGGGTPAPLAAGRRFAHLSSTAGLAVVAGTVYVVVRHPSLVSALGADVSRWLGWPVWLGQFLSWLLVLLPLLVVARFVYLRLLAPLLWLLVPLTRRVSRPLPRKGWYSGH